MRYDKLDKEIDEARSEMDPAKRRKMYQGIQKKLMEDIPAIPLVMMHFAHCYPKNLTGFPEIDPVWGFDFYPLRYVADK